MRVVLCLFLILVVLPMCGGVRCQSHPAQTRLSQTELESTRYDRFFSRFGDETLRRKGGMIYTTPTSNGPTFVSAKDAAGTYVAIEAGPEFALAVYFDADGATNPPPMQFQLLARRDLVNESGFVGEVGDPLVLADLNVSQCGDVLQHGIPESLIDAMITAAYDAGWRPETPVPHQFGRIIYVSPDTHF